MSVGALVVVTSLALAATAGALLILERRSVAPRRMVTRWLAGVALLELALAAFALVAA